MKKTVGILATLLIAYASYKTYNATTEEYFAQRTTPPPPHTNLTTRIPRTTKNSAQNAEAAADASSYSSYSSSSSIASSAGFAHNNDRAPRPHAARRVSPAAPLAAVEACADLSCARRHAALEPSWSELAFQPRIDWRAGGIRGDCVAGEIEYLRGKYCEGGAASRGRPSGAGAAAAATTRWPSLERLSAIDVHTNGMPQGTLAELSSAMRGRTLLVMGDSVMEQFYNTLQCGISREGIRAANTPEFERFVEQNKPLWRLGKRKMPPKLPEQTIGGMRLLYARVTTYQPDEVAAAVRTADAIVLNWGLHYGKLDQYRTDLHEAFATFERHAAEAGKAAIFVETGAQHFKAADRRGYSTGEWESRDKSTDRNCACSATEDFHVNSRNRALYEVLGSGRYPRVQVLPFYNLTRPRWRWHFGNCTHRPNGWNYGTQPPRARAFDWTANGRSPLTPRAFPSTDTCCDCTHFCFSPTFWGAHLHNLIELLKGSSLDVASATRPPGR